MNFKSIFYKLKKIFNINIHTNRPAYVGRPNILNSKKFLIDSIKILNSKILTNDGIYVKKFEDIVSKISGSSYAIAVNNATIGLALIFKALDLKGEIIIPSFTFIASAHASEWAGLKPVFVDVNPDTHSINIEKIEQSINEKTCAILGVHLWGLCCEVDEIDFIADKYNIPVIFDAAQAFDSKYKNRKIGELGLASIISFHATKYINSIEGGAILTNDRGLSEKLKKMRNFGFSGFDNVSMLGINGKMNEFCAAMGISNIGRLKLIKKINFENYKFYKKLLKDIDGIELLNIPTHLKFNYQYIVLNIDSDKLGINRDQLIAKLNAKKIFARKYYYPGCHKSMPYSSREDVKKSRLNITESLSKSIMVMPTGSNVSFSDITFFVKQIRGIIKNDFD